MTRTLSDAQIWSLVAYLESLGGEVTVTADDLAAAAESGQQAGGGTPGASGGAASTMLAGGSTDPVQLIQAGSS